VVELHHAVRQDERIVVGQRGHARAKSDMSRALGCRGDEHLRRGDDLEAARMMLADPRLVVVQFVDMLQQFHVALERERRVLGQVVERRQEDAAAQIAHGWPLGVTGR
jgi:hypothetical protein